MTKIQSNFTQISAHNNVTIYQIHSNLLCELVLIRSLYVPIFQANESHNK